MIDQICRELQSHKQWLARYTKHPEDIFQDSVIALLTQGESKIIELHASGKLNAYFAKTIKNILHDEYKKPRIKVVYTDELDHIPAGQYNLPKTEEQIKKDLIDSVKGYWYDRTIFSLYLEKESVRGVAEITKIPFQTLAETISKCKQDILNDYTTAKMG